MRVIEHLERAERTLFSFEIIPPPRGKTVREIIVMVEQVAPLQPPFIDVTSHMAEASYEEQPDGTIRRRVRKKRPGSLSICGIIQNRFGLDTVAHLLCTGFTREETEDACIELNYLGIHNVLAVRGDQSNYRKSMVVGRSRNTYAEDLVAQLVDLRQARYLDEIANSEPIVFCIGVGGYPETHLESPNVKTDLMYLKRKVDAGADYIVTQMCFDNAAYLSFVENCRAAGITVPIIPGLKILDNVRQISSLPKHFHISLPDDLVDEVLAAPDHAREIGLRWGRRQVEDLMNKGVPCLHFYVMNDAGDVAEMIRNLG